MKGEMVDLSRGEVKRVAEFIHGVVARVKGRVKAAEELGVSGHYVGTILKVPAAMQISRLVLGRIAEKAGGTIEELIAGKLGGVPLGQGPKEAMTPELYSARQVAAGNCGKCGKKREPPPLGTGTQCAGCNSKTRTRTAKTTKRSAVEGELAQASETAMA